MPYITQEYYTNDFAGVIPSDVSTLAGEIRRASDIIDFLLNYQVTDVALYHVSIQRMIMLATAKLTEFYVMNGGYQKIQMSDTEVQSAGIGSFSYSKSAVSGVDNSMTVKLPNEVITILLNTGLMNQRVYSSW